jgi:hypothetical protein
MEDEVSRVEFGVCGGVAVCRPTPIDLGSQAAVACKQRLGEPVTNSEV